MPNAIEIEMASPSIVIISLIGEYDIARYESLKAALARAAIRAPNVLVDLSHCTLVDGAALGLLLDSQNVVTRDGGRFGIVLPNEPNAVTRTAGRTPLRAGPDLCLRPGRPGQLPAGRVRGDSATKPGGHLGGIAHAIRRTGRRVSIKGDFPCTELRDGVAL